MEGTGDTGGSTPAAPNVTARICIEVVNSRTRGKARWVVRATPEAVEDSLRTMARFISDGEWRAWPAEGDGRRGY